MEELLVGVAGEGKALLLAACSGDEAGEAAGCVGHALGFEFELESEFKFWGVSPGAAVDGVESDQRLDAAGGCRPVLYIGRGGDGRGSGTADRGRCTT